MASIGSIVLGIEAQTGKSDKGLHHSGNALVQFEHQLHHIKSAVGALAATEIAEIFFKIGETAVEAAHKMAEFVEHSIGAMTEMSLLAHRIGANIEGFGGLAYASRVAGVDMESLGTAMQKMQVNIGDALMAVTPASKAFERLGLTAEDLANMDPVEAFKEIGTAISELPSDAIKASVAVDIFGKSGAGLLNVLNSGAAGINKWAEEAAALGVSFNAVSSERVHEAHAAMIRLGAVMEGIGNILAAELAPMITVVAEEFVHFCTHSIDLGVLVSEVIKNIGKSAALTAGVLQKMIHPLDYMMSGGQGWSGEVQDWFDGLSEAAERAGEHMGHAHEHIESMIPETDTLGDKVRELTNSLEMQAATFGMGSTQASLYKLEVEGASEAQLELARAYASVIEQQEKQKNIDAIGSKLKEQIDLYGKTAHEIELWKAAQMGASEEELKALQAMADKLDALDAQKKAAEDQEKYMDGLKKKAEQFYESTRTPLEKYQDEIKQLDELMAKGLLDQDTYDRATKAAEDKLEPKEKEHGEKFSGAVELGSAEGRSAVLKNRLNSGNNSLQKTASSHLAEARKQTIILAAINSQNVQPEIFTIAP